jgi:hypothetical protein
MSAFYEFSVEQNKKLRAWIAKLPPAPSTAVGGRLSYNFVPTSIGTLITVNDCVSGEELDLSDM